MTIPLTALFCRHQIARQKPISFWVACLGALSATLIYLLCAFSPDIFTRFFWNYLSDDGNFWPVLFILVAIGIPFVMCLVSAALVVGYYRGRTKSKNHVA